MKTLIVIAIAFLLSVSAEDKPKARFDEDVREDIFAGFNGDDDRLAAGVKRCDEVLAKDPKHAEAMVWRGAARVYQAGQAFRKKDTAAGLKLWTSGHADMDAAVKLEPENPGVRIPRVSVIMQAVRAVPDGQKKALTEKALEDFRTIIKLHEDRKEFDKLGTHPRGEIRMGYADALRLSGDGAKSKEQLELVKKELPDSKYAKRADEWLAAKDDAKLSHSCIGCHTKK